MAITNKQQVKIQVKRTWHGFKGRRSCQIFFNGKLIEDTLNPIAKEWVDGDNKQNWCVEEYILPVKGIIKFVAKANGEKPIEKVFDLSETNEINIEGFTYKNQICGWLQAI